MHLITPVRFLPTSVPFGRIAAASALFPSLLIYLLYPLLFLSDHPSACILVTTVDARIGRILNFLDVISCSVLQDLHLGV